MNKTTLHTNITEENRRELMDRIEQECGPNWATNHLPGSLGCHELLDRTSVIANLVEAHVLAHPACVQNAEWYELAERAVDALNELYQRVGAEHLSRETTD